MTTERHPLEPFLPEAARILMLGSFPPKKEKWSMDFFYPNFINDMWRIFGTVFFLDRSHFIAPDGKHFDRDSIKKFCEEKGIALYDTATEVIRLKDNASDKFLEVVSPTDIKGLLYRLPGCMAVVTTGEKATDIVCSVFGCAKPETGSHTEIHLDGEFERDIHFYRMPSSSRAYPLPLEKKAEIYREMFLREGLI